MGDVRREAERVVDSDIPDQEKELRASELIDRVERDISAGLWAERVRLGLPALRSDAVRTLLLTQDRFEAEIELLRNQIEQQRLLERDRIDVVGGLFKGVPPTPRGVAGQIEKMVVAGADRVIVEIEAPQTREPAQRASGSHRETKRWIFPNFSSRSPAG